MVTASSADGAGKTTTMRLNPRAGPTPRPAPPPSMADLRELKDPLRTVGRCWTPGRRTRTVGTQPPALDRGTNDPVKRVDEVLDMVGLAVRGRPESGHALAGHGANGRHGRPLLGDPPVLLFSTSRSTLDLRASGGSHVDAHVAARAARVRVQPSARRDGQHRRPARRHRKGNGSRRRRCRVRRASGADTGQGAQSATGYAAAGLAEAGLTADADPRLGAAGPGAAIE